MHEEFPLSPDIIHLNHAAVGPWPKRTHQAVVDFASENLHQGSKNYPLWLQKEQQLREQFKTLIKARSSDEIALLKNTSEGLSIIAAGLEWKPGDKVVISNQEFPSNRICWESLGSKGVEVIQVDLAEESTAEASIIKYLDSQTRLLAISWIQYASGTRVDLARLGDACKRLGILFCIDAIQGLGAYPLNVQKSAADFVVADGHKWMLGPEGVALFYCRQEIMEQVSLHQFGWHMTSSPGDFDTQVWEPAANAQRFECGSPNMLGIHALSSSLSLLLELGPKHLEEAINQRIEYLFDKLGPIEQVEVLTSALPDQRAGIFVFRVTNSEDLYRFLMERGVLCALRGGGVRFSPHFYTPLEHLDKAVALVQEFLESYTSTA